MSVLDFIHRIWRSQSKHYLRVPIPAAHQDDPVVGPALEAEKGYLRVWLAEMFLRDDRRLFRDYEPVLHTAVSLQFGANAGSAPKVEFPTIAGRAQLPHLDGGTLGRGVVVNQPLTGLFPFRGGTLEIAAGLVAYRSKDYFQAFLGVAEGLSSLLTVPQLSAALPVTRVAVDGMSGLLGAGEKDVHLLYMEAFADAGGQGTNHLAPGYMAIVRATAYDLHPEELHVKNGRLHRGRDLASAEPLEGYDYVLLRFEIRAERDDYASFTEIMSELDAAVEAQLLGEEDKAKALLLGSVLAAYRCSDLTRQDQLRVAQALREDFAARTGGTEGAPFPEDRPRTLADLVANRALPVDEAAAERSLHAMISTLAAGT